MPHYWGVHIQNELISLLGEKIRHEIISILKVRKYFSIILDSTTNASHKDQLTVLVRLGSILWDSFKGLTINDLLDFMETHNNC